MQATADEGHDHGSVSPDGRFTPNVDGAVFPPQPRNVSNVRIHTPLTESVEAVRVLGVGAASFANVVGDLNAEAAEAVLLNADVRSLLGDRYTLLQSAPVRDKKKRSSNAIRVEYFSYSENRTVVVESVNGVVAEINRYAASDRQSPLGEDEKARAIDIARQYWVDRGDPRVNRLTGYAIQTYQPDGSHYDSRVAYVSFHAQSPEPPELLTWVDLSEEQVFRAESER